MAMIDVDTLYEMVRNNLFCRAKYDEKLVVGLANQRVNEQLEALIDFLADRAVEEWQKIKDEEAEK